MVVGVEYDQDKQKRQDQTYTILAVSLYSCKTYERNQGDDKLIGMKDWSGKSQEWLLVG